MLVRFLLCSFADNGLTAVPRFAQMSEMSRRCRCVLSPFPLHFFTSIFTLPFHPGRRKVRIFRPSVPRPHLVADSPPSQPRCDHLGCPLQPPLASKRREPQPRPNKRAQAVERRHDARQRTPRRRRQRSHAHRPSPLPLSPNPPPTDPTYTQADRNWLAFYRFCHRNACYTGMPIIDGSPTGAAEGISRLEERYRASISGDEGAGGGDEAAFDVLVGSMARETLGED